MSDCIRRNFSNDASLPDSCFIFEIKAHGLMRGRLLAEPSLEAFTPRRASGLRGMARPVPRARRGGRLLVVNPEMPFRAGCPGPASTS